MANTPDLCTCSDANLEATTLPIDPWRSLAVHFGMLLGVDDFRTIDAYHRGKHWLHGSWLHGEGVVWGLAPSLVAAQGELRIEAGLAIDRAGRELHLDHAACIDLGKWFAKHAEQLFEDGLTPEPDGSVRIADATVRARFVGCLDRQVPAMVEPCDGAGRTTAYSRVFETVELELIAGLMPAGPRPYRRLRLLAGLDQPRLDEDGNPVAEDQEVIDTRATILAMSGAAQPPAFEQAFRRYASLDAAELAPAEREDGSSALGSGLLPAVDPVYFVLATLEGLVLRPGASEGSWVFDSLEALHWQDRPTHVAVRPLQDIVAAALLACCGDSPAPAPVVAGPRVIRRQLNLDPGPGELHLDVDKPIAPGTEQGQLDVAAFVPGSGWVPLAVHTIELSTDGTRVRAGFPEIPASASTVRVRFGHNEPPVLGVDGWPLAGADDDPPGVDPHHGRPFVHTQRRGAR